jgi:RNA recognition motif-containing protein
MEPSIGSASRQACKVFVGGLSWSTDDERLRSYFENFGVVVESFVSYDKYTGESG